MIASMLYQEKNDFLHQNRFHAPLNHRDWLILAMGELLSDQHKLMKWNELISIIYVDVITSM